MSCLLLSLKGLSLGECLLLELFLLLSLSTSLGFGSLQLLGSLICLLLGLSKLLEVRLSLFSIVVRLDLGSLGGLLSF